MKEDCLKKGHKPGVWMRVDYNQQERRCQRCNLVVVTANIPQSAKDDGGGER